MSKELNIPFSQMSLNYVLSTKAVDNLVFGVSRPEQIQTNIDALNIKLSEETISQVCTRTLALFCSSMLLLILWRSSLMATSICGTIQADAYKRFTFYRSFDAFYYMIVALLNTLYYISFQEGFWWNKTMLTIKQRYERDYILRRLLTNWVAPSTYPDSSSLSMTTISEENFISLTRML